MVRVILLTGLLCVAASDARAAEASLSLARDKHWLVIKGEQIPGGEIRINYLEAYCRPNSTDADWVKHTVIGHESKLISLSEDGKVMKLRDTLKDGVVVDHVITAGADDVTFDVTATNPTDRPSEAHWAQPCVRLGTFTGHGPDKTKDDYAYLPKCFIFLDGKLTRMPTPQWATEARYKPGQVWVPAGVPRTDVNPRPVSQLVPSNGLIGCFSGDEKLIFATAWSPYQELFQGVARCLHSDFRIGGLKAGESKRIKGKAYIVPADAAGLVKRYEGDFPPVK
ncbi:MAG TPA: hypothetical protein VEA69_17985 [Tepidisphaeraceae bacterium]|nr:hypothetical protein [Tepidisphaeraceae bacterium]